MSKRKSRAATALSVLVGAAAALWSAAPAHAQAQAENGNGAEAPIHRKTVSDFGARLSDAEAGMLLRQMHDMVEQSLAASRAAEAAGSVAEVKLAADRVAEAVWGLASGVQGESAAEVPVPGWKERWQVTGAEFDPKYAERLGASPPTITDPDRLGIAGRGRAVRARLQQIVDDSAAPAARREAAARALASLNDVIGWTHITKGYKVREVQPRPSLTYLWAAPSEFWNSSADTGWLYEAYSQAVNILKTDYAGDVAEARGHAEGMSRLLGRVLAGMDADGDGVVEAKMMEGGLLAALDEAAKAGLQ